MEHPPFILLASTSKTGQYNIASSSDEDFMHSTAATHPGSGKMKLLNKKRQRTIRAWRKQRSQANLIIHPGAASGLIGAQTFSDTIQCCGPQRKNSDINWSMTARLLLAASMEL